MKRMKKVIPAAFVLSSALLVAPGFSSAATDTTNVGNLPVVISAQEGKAPMTAEQVAANGTQLPYIPTGPYEEFPSQWHVSTEDGKIIDYAYVDVVAQQDNVSMDKIMKFSGYKYVKPDGTWIKDDENYAPKGNKGDVLYSIAIPKTDPIVADTKLKKDLSWKLIDSNVIDKNAGYHWSKAVTSGISHNISVGLSQTIGMEVGFFDIAKVSTSLTWSFGYQHTISEESTVTKTFDFNPKYDYAYDQYRTALYQQVANYSVIPGTELQKWMSDRTANDPINQVLRMVGKGNAYEYKVKKSVDYPVDVLVALTSK
ncbi:hypothetical protein [Bacillus pseudomycoides]|jgi:hypothetical protein|uniref:hypothetical protein n=2 Tax=Bacillus pseudomycoides TaxID=64104 RepID=UPI000BED90E0|nr:hypothetical protein [Bacillus pseudomycoides]MBD5799433.1 hypothetical protein [Bacillus pseudomycoides]PDZ70757.1 hypothetical protein CON58_27125 [Bacillus pseudomycoides]PEK30298.1 hypothetical protein CN691_20195 [Bacillus pseudomycoides]PEK59463.1 hypothetical protein CN593_29055 [Bacillus pseudomycoides]PEO82640.1 hypothetical protein CN571_25255 [Bacillus pseudomycoides]